MAKVEKLLRRFDSTFADRNFYEAHQIARTIFYRQVEAEKFEELSRFLFQKALDFIAVDEPTSALDLAELFAQTLTKGSLPLNEERLGQIEALFNKLPPKLRSATDNNEGKDWDCRTPFANRLIRWSAQVTPKGEKKPNQMPGDSRLLQIVAPMALQQQQHEEEEGSGDEEFVDAPQKPQPARKMMDDDELD